MVALQEVATVARQEVAVSPTPWARSSCPLDLLVSGNWVRSTVMQCCLLGSDSRSLRPVIVRAFDLRVEVEDEPPIVQLPLVTRRISLETPRLGRREPPHGAHCTLDMLSRFRGFRGCLRGSPPAHTAETPGGCCASLQLHRCA